MVHLIKGSCEVVQINLIQPASEKVRLVRVAIRQGVSKIVNP